MDDEGGTAIVLYKNAAALAEVRLSYLSSTGSRQRAHRSAHRPHSAVNAPS